MRDDRTSREREQGALGAHDVTALSTDDLLGLLMKLDIQDPNTDPETHSQLQAVLREVRRRGLEPDARRPPAPHRAP